MNSTPVLFQNHHVAVAESAVIGYPHEIKGEGEMHAFLKCHANPYGTAYYWESPAVIRAFMQGQFGFV